MRRFIATAQVLYVTVLIGLLSAGLPAFADHEPPRFSLTGFLVGTAIALSGFGIASLVSELAGRAEAVGSTFELQAMRVGLVAFLGAMTAFTAMMYLQYSWLFFAIAGFSGLGIACIVGAQLAHFMRRARDV
jgi:hypothetical protein